MVDSNDGLGGRSAASVLLLCALGPCFFGTAFLATQYLPATPLWNAASRVLPAGLALFALRPALPQGIWWMRSLMLGILNFGAFFALQAVAAHRLPGAIVATISSAQCLVVPAIVLALGMRVGSRQLIAPLLGIVGVVLLVLHGGAGLDSVGIAASIALALLSGSGIVLIRRWAATSQVHPLSAVAWQLSAGGIVLLPVAAVFEGAPPSMTLGQVGAAVWLALGATAAGFALFFGGLYRGVEATTASRLMLLAPVVASVIGWACASESLSPTQLAGITFVIAAQLVGIEGTRATTARAAAEAGLRHWRPPRPTTPVAGATSHTGRAA